MIDIKKKIKGFWIAIVILIPLLLGLIGILNIFGGVKISSQKLVKNLDGLNESKLEIGDVKMKLGFKSSISTTNLSALVQDKFEMKINELSLKKSILKNNISEISIKDGEILVYIDENETIENAIMQLKKIIIGKTTNEKNIELIKLENINLSLIKLPSSTKTIINNFTGTIESLDDTISFDGNFNIGINPYQISGSIRAKKGDFDIKLESKNLVFKTTMENNSGKLSFSINNITKFLNDITPDTINFNLGAFDGVKNSFYFESDVTYNDVRKSIEFEKSKLQLFGGKEESVKIENLSNDRYKISIDIDELDIVKEAQSPNDFFVNDSKTPVFQFSNVFPQISILLEVKAKVINLKDLQDITKIQNLNIISNLGYGEIDSLIEFNIDDKLYFKTKGMMQNYEKPYRKGILEVKLEGKKVDLSEFNIVDIAKYYGEEEQDFKLDLTAIISGDKGIFEISSFTSSGIDIKNSKLEFDLYLKDRDYILDLNMETFDVSKIKFNLTNALKIENNDLFKTLFNYLKFKDFAYLHIACKICKIENEDYDINIKTNITNGKIELEDFSILNPKIEIGVNGILDIRNPQNNTANLSIEVLKWEDFEFEKLTSVYKIFNNFNEFKFPALDDFNGSFSIYMESVKNKFNTLNFADARWRLSSGILKQISSRIVINETPQQDFMNLEANLKQSTPAITLTTTLPLVESRGILSLVLGKKDFNEIAGKIALGASLRTSGFFVADLIKNANANFEVKSNKLELNKFGVDEVAKVLINPAISFKKITNTEIHKKAENKGVFGLIGKINFIRNEFSLENLELKSNLSSSIFVGKLALLPEKKFALQLIGKTATVGADLNKKLEGVMPVYLTCAIVNENELFDVKFDFSQVNKYSEARRVLFK